MGKRVLLVLAVAILAMVIVPATASASLVNEYGMHFAGQTVCVDCHAFFGGTTTQTTHSRMAKLGLVPAPPADWTEFRAAGTPPVVQGTPPVLFNSGGHYDIAQPWITLGDLPAGLATEYIFWAGDQNNPTGMPWNLVEGLSAEPKEGHPLPIDEGDYIVGAEAPDEGLFDVVYGCQRCHMLGTTAPVKAGQTVNNPAATAQSATTATQWARADNKTAADFMSDPAVSYPGMSIQCENCHGTGVAATAAEGAHTNTGVKVNTTLAVLGQSQVCGQCHGSYTAVRDANLNDLTPGIYGYTPNLPLRDFVDVNGTPINAKTKLPTSAPYTQIPTDAEFMANPTWYWMFPNGSNAKGGHYYYDEWVTTAHSYRPALANDSPDATVFQNNYTGHFGPASSRPSGCWKCHTGEGYLKSKNAKIAANFTPTADDVGFMGQECVTCHNGHPWKGTADSIVHDTIRDPDKAGQRSAAGLAADNQSICEDCHNWQMEVLGSSPAYKPLKDITAHLISHPQREVRHNRALMVDVDMSSAGQFMPGAKCEDCHMPKTNKADNRFSHGMKIMMPGGLYDPNDPTKSPQGAVEWMTAAGPSYMGEDSCSKCHAGETRQELQANIDKWQTNTSALAADAEEAILAAQAGKPDSFFLPANASDPDYILIGRATWNFKGWEADSSDGVHNPAYIKAGLEKAEQLAKSAGGSFKNLFASKSVVPGGTGFVTGKVVNGDGSGAAGASLKLSTGAMTTADAQGNFAFMVNPGGVTIYSVKWLRSGDSRTDLTSTSMTVGVAKLASKTTLKASATSILVNKSIKLSGAVAPNASGQMVKIMYRRTTSGAWKAWATTTLSLTSQYSKTKALTSKGTWYFKSMYAGNATVASSSSVIVKVIVK